MNSSGSGGARGGTKRGRGGYHPGGRGNGNPSSNRGGNTGWRNSNGNGTGGQLPPIISGNNQGMPGLMNAFFQLGSNNSGNGNQPPPLNQMREGQGVPGEFNYGAQRDRGGDIHYTPGRGQGRGRGSHDRRSNRGRQVDKKKYETNGQGGEDVSNSSDSDDESRRAFQRPVVKREKKFEGPVFGFKRLYKFLSSSPDEVLLSINKDKEDWKSLLESDDLNGEKLIIAIQVMGEKICADVPVLLQQQTNAVTSCCSKAFINKLDEAIPKIAQGVYIPVRRRNNEFDVNSEPIKVMENILQFCSFVVKTMPETAFDFLSKLIFTCMGASVMCDPSMTVMNKFKALNDQLTEIRQREKKKEETAQRQRRYGFNNEDEAEFDAETPPENFRDIEIIPSISEIRSRSDQVFLRPNKQTGSYKDANHYLDVQFRLLREDFVQPLRKGVHIFLKDQTAYLNGKKMPLGEVRLYTDISFLRVEKERDTIVHKLQLDERNYKRIKWDKSKRLLTGSLILLTTVKTCFHLNNTHFGVVFSRNTKELEKGILTVIWEGTPPVYDDDEEYFMLESEVYLEAYRHTLATLKNLELEKFPMKKFIVDANSSVEAPHYLKTATKLLEVTLASGEDMHIAPLHCNWPTAEDFGLDENQLNAFRAALTSEFTIIQGPPGTGKTFLGLKVAEVLLKNSGLWEDPEGNPITVVCYTNHALDQFLEGILKFYQREEIPAEIIRIGGRCKSEVLAKYSLREVRHRNRRKIPLFCHLAIRDARDNINELEAERSSRMNEVTGLQDVQGVVDFEKLSTWSIIQPEYPKAVWSSLQNLEWLGISDGQLSRDKFSVHDVLRNWFKIRQYPKNQKKQFKAQEQQRQEAVQRTNLDAAEEDEYDEEDYDMEELLENRILDDIFLEAETTHKTNLGRRLCYLPDCSVHACEKKMKLINKNLHEANPQGKWAQPPQRRETMRGEFCTLENRRNLLGEICRLYKEQLLDLPDTADLLKDIKAGATVHYNRLKMEERWALYFAIVEWSRRKVAESVADLEKRLMAAQNELRNAMDYGDGQVLRGCKVIGLTTTGAAKYNNLLKMIKSKIVIVEEAAEVFESHIVTCITENCQQLILIGDHRQLRPSPTVYDLAIKYHLDLSLFERMIKNNLHCYQLKVQHRMRPDISDLILGPIYEELVNHDSVKLYPDVMGVTKNVFFITHTEKEVAEKDSMSKSNLHEAKFIAGLCRYLNQQGYTSDEITVLTMYTGQMFLLKKEIHATCKGVRITCVDNFQGEENKIILLSLVRSNDSGKIGFLGIDNRICVSLSRAQHGLFVIGNMEQMVKNSTWNQIKEKLDRQGQIGPELELECQIHGIRTRVKKGEDFLLQVPQGGCLNLCDTTLPCSHKCGQICHVVDKDHQLYKCRQDCLKKCQNALHPCKGRCSDSCPPCQVQVEKTLPCELQHKKMMPCYQKVDSVVCFQQVLKKLPCDHEETMACHISIHTFVCKVVVNKKLPCGHERHLACHVDPESIRCKIVTPKMLPCEHTQNAECWVSEESIKCETMVPKKFPKCNHETKIKCGEKSKPIFCKDKCSTRLNCGHACVKVCHVDDDPHHMSYQCRKPCSNNCPAGLHKCQIAHPCYKTPCPPCKETVLKDLPCGHRKELACHVDVKTYECLEKCERLLNDLHCRHQCPNLCYQPCGPCDKVVKKRAPCGHGQSVLCSKPARKEDCEELVSPKVTPICGHKNSMVPCKHDGLPAEEIVKFCQHPCGFTFSPASGGGCDHTCMGTCSSCLQGRIHMKCSSDCGRQLVCGHVCNVPCSSVCPPCQKPCLMKCEHSECTQKCGEPCSECKEKCTWICPHKVCSKLCGEPCDREPCNEPCPKKLKCGHDCVGFCGERCPPLCRICDREELTSFFLYGNEEDDDARFVYLEDCRHAIEVEGLEQWLLSSGGGQIGAKQCPRCKTTIRNCRRFGNLIRQHYQDIVKVKMRAFGNKANSERMRNACIGKLSSNPPMERLFPQLHSLLRDCLITEVHHPNGRTGLIPKTIDEFAMRSLEFIIQSADRAAHGILAAKQSEKGQLISPHYEEVLNVYRKTLVCMLSRQPLSRQELVDFNKELDRLDFFKQLMMRRSMPNCNPQNTNAYRTYQRAEKIVTSTLPFTPIREREFKTVLNELDDLLRSGLGITERERLDILQAMQMGQGHWYKCPNGHIYVIADCGGAMERSRCNECNAEIGGSNHQLLASNQLAQEMDGATRPAWPTNMMRY